MASLSQFSSAQDRAKRKAASGFFSLDLAQAQITISGFQSSRGWRFISNGGTDGT